MAEPGTGPAPHGCFAFSEGVRGTIVALCDNIVRQHALVCGQVGTVGVTGATGVARKVGCKFLTLPQAQGEGWALSKTLKDEWAELGGGCWEMGGAWGGCSNWMW